MKKITTILLMLSACVLSLSARELHADLTTTAAFAGSNGSWDSGTKTFTWTAGNNSRVVFSDLIGQNGAGISAWDTLVVNVTSCTASYRIDFQLSTGTTISNGASGSKTAFWSAGTKKIVLSEVLKAAPTDTVTEIRLNTNSNSGNLVLGDIYLIDDAKPYSTASAGLVKRTGNGNCDFGGKLEWTAGNANTMQVFSMTAGNLSNYTSMKVNFRNFYDRGSIGGGIKTRVVFRTSSADVKGEDYYTLTTSGSIGTSEKTINLTTLLTNDQHDQRAEITQVVLGGGGSANAGFVMIDPSDIKLVKSDESELVCTSITARGGGNSDNVSYKENIFYWTANSANTMQLFSLKAGDLSGYDTLEFTTSDFDKLDGSWTGSPYLYRVIFYKSGTEVTTRYFASAGTKTINLSDLGSDQALVTEIVFGGANTGDCTKGLLTINPSSVLLKGYCYPITYNAGSGEGITGSQADDRKLDDVALTLPGIVFTRPNYVQVGWATSDGGKQVYALGGSYTANDQATLYPVWRPTIQTTQAAGNWSATSTWTNGIVPTEIDSVVLAHTVTVDNIAAVAKDVTIAPGGQLVIEAANKLKVVNQVRKWTGAAYTATDATDMIIGSSASGNGALIMGNYDGSQAVKATVNFYSISGGSKNSDTSVNQYIGTPFSDANVLNNWYNSWIYRLNDAGTAWERINGSSVMNPFEGYNIIYNGSVGHVYEMEGTLVPTTNSVITLAHTTDGAENVLANSWTAPIQINAITTESFVGADATIYIFNAGSPNDYASNGASSGASAGQYQTIPVAGSIPSGYEVIPSMQSFSVNAASGATHTLTLDYSAVVYDVASSAPIQPNHAPRRAQNTNSHSLVVNVVGASGWGDNVRIYECENYTTGFDNGYDGRKMYGIAEAPQLTVRSTDGNLSVAAVPNMEGCLLSFRAGSLDQQYTFAFDYDGDDEMYLHDLQTGLFTRVHNASSYSFTAADMDEHTRFVLTSQPSVATDVTDVKADDHVELEAGRSVKLLDKGRMYILRDGILFDMTGCVIKCIK